MENYIKLYDQDISDIEKEYIINNCEFVAIDTETTGLDPLKDKLCLIQIYDGKSVFILKYDSKLKYNNLIELLESNKLRKIFHHANFDLRFLISNFKNIDIKNVACTKVGAKLLNGKSENSSLKYLVEKYIGANISKELQVSNWESDNLSEAQIEYAANDVVFLYTLWNKVENMLKENKIENIAQSCFEYLPTNAILHNNGVENIFIY